MSILNITGLKKILGSREILRGGDLRIERGEKMGCVGRNGEGKTTLLRLIEGEETPDGGEVKLSRGCRLAYVEQRPDFAPGRTVRSYVEGGLSEVHTLEAELEKTGEAMGSLEGAELDAVLKRHGELTERMDFLGGWETERTVETVLSGIGLATHLWDREARTLSGGEKSRTAIARELISIPDLLLLDEPTNHLDLAGIEWIESYIHEMQSAVFIVSHDRRLLDRVVTTIVEVERGLLTRYTGNYSRYVLRKEEHYREEFRAWEQQQAEIRREDSFIKKHMGSQRTAEAKGRRKRLGNVVRLPRPYNDVRRPVIRMGGVERGGEEVLSVEHLAVGHGKQLLFTATALRIGRGERIGVVGPNGSGKTTLLKVLAGILRPISGEIRLGHKANCGYYDQETSELREDGTPYTEIRRDHPQMTDLDIRKHLARFLFRGSDIDHSVSSLSGGERARLSLCRLVLTGPSWLALDEPTNHLDLAGRTALEEMLSEFKGALVCVSHDRAFLDSLVHTIFEVKAGSVRVFRGNYTDYRASIEFEESGRRAEVLRAKDKEARRASQRTKNNKVRGEPTRSSAKRKKKKAHNPWRVEQLERDIITLESEREALLAAMGTEEVFKDADAVRETQFRLAEVERDLNDKNKEWEESAG